MSAVRLVVAGGSWGALAATCLLLDELPTPLPVPVVLVLHRSRESDAERLRTIVRGCSGQELVEIEDQCPVRPGAVHLAPVDYHLLVHRDGFSLTTDSPVHHSRPSIDLAFESASAEYGEELAAVLLSGSGRDGADGFGWVGRRGGRTLVQAPWSAERPEMPAAGLRAWEADIVAGPADLGRYLTSVLLGGEEGSTRAPLPHPAPWRGTDLSPRPEGA